MGKDQASSTRAAALAAKKSTTQSGFGGFSGSTALAPGSFAFGASAIASGAVRASGAESSVSSSDATAFQSSVTLDGEIAQSLKHLSKKEPVTKIKALQSLREIICSRQSTPDATATLPPFIYQYRRLFLDTSRMVRREATSLMGELIVASSRGSAPHLKSLMGSWYQSQLDPHPEVSNAAKNGFQACFSTPKKQLDALIFCKSEIMDHLVNMVMATREMMGDPKRESPEELEDRHERAVASSLGAIASFLDTLTTAQPSTDPPQSLDAALVEFDKSMAEKALPFILKTLIKSKSKLIRSSTYSLLGAVSVKRPAIFRQTIVSDGPCDSKSFDDACLGVLGSFQESEPSNHGSMWSMILSFARAFPDSWSRCNFRKAILPRLKSLLRHNCYGSSVTSSPALLPLFSLMSKSPGLIGPSTELPCALLESIWEGAALETSAMVHPPAATAYEECLSWCLMQSHHLSCAIADQSQDDTASDYCHQLLSHSLASNIGPVALMLDSNGGNSKSKALMAGRIISDCVSKVVSSSSKSSPAASNAIEEAIKSTLSSAVDVLTGQKLSRTDPRVISDQIEQLLDLISAGLKDKSLEDPPEEESFTKRLASFVATQLSATEASADSTLSLQLVASLVRKHGASISAPCGLAPKDVPFMNLESILEAFCSASTLYENKPIIEVHSDLIACLLLQQKSSDAWSAVMDKLASIGDDETRSARTLKLLDKSLLLVAQPPSSDAKRLSVRSWLKSTNLSLVLGVKLRGAINPTGGYKARKLLSFTCGINPMGVCLLNDEDLALVLEVLSRGLMNEGPASLPFIEALGEILVEGASFEVIHDLVRSQPSSVAAIISKVADLSWNILLLSEREEMKVELRLFGSLSEEAEEADEESGKEQGTDEESGKEQGTASSASHVAAKIWNNGHLLALALKAFNQSGMLSIAHDLVSSVTKSIVALVPLDSNDPSLIAWKVASVYKALKSIESQSTYLDTIFATARGPGGGLICSLAVNLYIYIGSSVFSHGRSWLLEYVLSHLAEDHPDNALLDTSLVESVLSSFLSICHGEEDERARETLLEALDHLTSPSTITALVYALKTLTSDPGCNSIISSYFERSILPSYQTSSAPASSLESLARVHSDVLRLTSPLLRLKLPSSSPAAISSASTFWMNSSKRLPMVVVGPSWLSIHVLRAALSCFPLPPPLADNKQVVESISNEEAPALAALVKHQARAVRHAAIAASRRLQPDVMPDSSLADSSLADHAQSLVLDLEAAACHYLVPKQTGNKALIDDEQFIRDAVRVFEETVTHIQAHVTSLSFAIRKAASAILSSTPSSQVPSQDFPSGLLSIQLLSRLREKGLLRGHPCLPLLTESLKSAIKIKGWEEGALSAARLSRIILTRDKNPQGPKFDEINEHQLKIILLLGSISRLTAIASEDDEGGYDWSRHPTLHTFLHELHASSVGGLRGGSIPSLHSTRGSWVYRACHSHDEFDQSQAIGVDALDSLLSLTLNPSPLDDVAFMTILDPNSLLLSKICSPTSDPINGEDSMYPEFDSIEGSEELFLTSKCGVRGTLASCLVIPYSLDEALNEIEEAREEMEGNVGGDTNFPLTSFLTAWSLVLSQLNSYASEESGTLMLSHALRELSELPSHLLNALTPLLPLSKYQPNGSSSSLILQPSSSAAKEERSQNAFDSSSIALQLSSLGRPIIGSGKDVSCALILFSAALRSLPAGAQCWFSGLRDKVFSSAVEGYTAARESPSLIAYELQQVQERNNSGASSVGGGEGNFSVRAAEGGREVVAVLEVEDGAKLELSIFLPSCTPLRPAECEVRKKVGVSEAKLRKWILSISVFMRSQNRSVADAIEVWKSNVDKEFQGVEPCLICYSVVSSHNNQLPKLQCKTCHVRFHPGCLLKWFKSSGKSVCVHCQSPW